MNAPNPILIMVINMTIVFAVLYVLGLFIRLIHIIDPTKTKKAENEPMIVESTKPVITQPKDDMADKTLAAVIVTALMAYGCKNFEIKSIKKL